MIYKEEKTKLYDYEIKKGFNGKGNPIFAIYWHDSLKYPGSVTIEESFKSFNEALINAKYNLHCGKNIGVLA